MACRGYLGTPRPNSARCCCRSFGSAGEAAPPPSKRAGGRGERPDAPQWRTPCPAPRHETHGTPTRRRADPSARGHEGQGVGARHTYTETATARKCRTARGGMKLREAPSPLSQRIAARAGPSARDCHGTAHVHCGSLIKSTTGAGGKCTVMYQEQLREALVD